MQQVIVILKILELKNYNCLTLISFIVNARLLFALISKTNDLLLPNKFLEPIT